MMSAQASISCGQCRHAYSLSAWDALPRVQTLTADEVYRHVVEWREDRVIEVRSCSACGRSMARIVERIGERIGEAPARERRAR
jgi:hypothetical protein